MSDRRRDYPNTWICGRDPLRVVPWADSLVDQLGHDMHSPYVETYWLPVLGPSAMMTARRLVEWLDESPDGVDVPLRVLGKALGLSEQVTAHSPVVRTLCRLVVFSVAATGGTTYAIRRRLQPLPPRYLDRLPGYLAERHALDVEAAR
jgi:hypothetical protein